VTSSGLKWESQFVKLCRRLSDNGTFSHIDFTYATSSSLVKESGTNTGDLAPYVAFTFAAMVAFCVLVSCSRDCVRAKSLVAVGGVASTCVATAAAFGFCGYFVVLFTDVNLAAPFLMLGSRFYTNTPQPSIFEYVPIFGPPEAQ
jgi:hypothetical protein